MEDIINGYLKEIGMQTKTVTDRYLGELIFPEHDNVISEFINRDGTWESPEQSWINKNVKSGDVVLNLGANIGYHSFIASRAGASVVIAVEPSKDLCTLIAANAVRLNISNIIIKNVAVTDSDSEMTLYYSNDNCGDNRIGNSEAGEFRETVKSVSMNTLLMHSSLPDVIIMDIQGWETKVISQIGVPDKNIKILFEFTPNFILQMGWSIEDEIESISKTGWNITDIFGNKTTLEDVYRMYKSDPTPENFFINLVAEWNIDE